MAKGHRSQIKEKKCNKIQDLLLSYLIRVSVQKSIFVLDAIRE